MNGDFNLWEVTIVIGDQDCLPSVQISNDTIICEIPKNGVGANRKIKIMYGDVTALTEFQFSFQGIIQFCENISCTKVR